MDKKKKKIWKTFFLMVLAILAILLGITAIIIVLFLR